MSPASLATASTRALAVREGSHATARALLEQAQELAAQARAEASACAAKTAA